MTIIELRRHVRDLRLIAQDAERAGAPDGVVDHLARDWEEAARRLREACTRCGASSSDTRRNLCPDCLTDLTAWVRWGEGR